MKESYKTPSTSDSMEITDMLPNPVELAWNHGYLCDLNNDIFPSNTNKNSQFQSLSFSEEGIKREASFYDKSPSLKYINSNSGTKEEAFAFSSIILNSDVSYNLTRLINNSPSNICNNHQSQFLSSISNSINESKMEVELTGVQTLNNGNITGNKREASEQGGRAKRMK